MCLSTINPLDGISRFKPNSRKTLKISLCFIATGLMLSACAVVPEPLSDQELINRVEANLSDMYTDQEPITGPLDLYEAVARGLKYNLDNTLILIQLNFMRITMPMKMLALPMAKYSQWHCRMKKTSSNQRRGSWPRILNLDEY